MRWFITKVHLVWLIGILVAVILALLVSGCIPVTIRPQFDDENKPIALPVTPVGSVSADGTLVPIYPVSSKSPTSTNWGAIGTVIGSITTALLAAYGINIRRVALKTNEALKIVCDLADDNASAENDEQVRLAKALAASRQIKAGVHDITQKARGK